VKALTTRTFARRGSLVDLWRTLLPLTIAIVVLGGTYVASTPATASAATAASQALKTNGIWPGVGKICEPGPEGVSSVRGVGSKTINIAVFNDAANTVEPGVGLEYVQQAQAFADWCNASGGINGRKIVIDNRDAALFNSGQVTTQACQSDFMAVGGGVVLDQPAVPIREKCGLGQITFYTVSDAGQSATFQVNPGNLSNKIYSAGYFGALTKQYPQAVKKAGMGTLNSPAILEPEKKAEYAAEAQGWKVLIFQEPPLSVPDWTPYIQQVQTKGVQALWPSIASGITPYFQAMSTAGYKPTFVILASQFYTKSTTAAVASISGLPPVYVETQWWPLEMASQNPSTEQLIQTLHAHAKGDPIDFNDEASAESWLLWAKSASACGGNLTVSCVLSHAGSEKNWDAGGLQAPVAQVVPSDENPVPSPCFAILKAEPNKFVYDKAVTKPTQSIWNCNPKGNVHLTPAELASLG
jgi:ABC-type branched-subunit amino acid transport system substrate-binding protein